MSRTATPTTPAASLYIEPWQTHLTHQGRAPRSLLELGLAQADYEHRSRVTLLKSLSKKLTLLEPLLEPLAAKGIRLARREFTSYDQGKTLRIQTLVCQHHDDALHAALLELGFAEVERKVWGSGADQVTLQLGRWLRVAIDVSRTAHAAAPSPAVETQGAAA